ncbi:hypothetical protein EVAR_65924_1 [Eumeta japonica]|uniref:Uncharacterized protein n=1 Tax=Eumeta variegata TaxID=151549 RepID=A0A4C2A620_EUMVA|nr:hypothetical protein EVAR_65924_1 [Eumeta japonica]
MPRCPLRGIHMAITRRRHPMPIGRDGRSPQCSNLLGLRTRANQQVASEVFCSVKVGHTPRTWVRGSSLVFLSLSPRKEKTKKKNASGAVARQPSHFETRLNKEVKSERKRCPSFVHRHTAIISFTPRRVLGKKSIPRCGLTRRYRESSLRDAVTRRYLKSQLKFKI